MTEEPDLDPEFTERQALLDAEDRTPNAADGKTIKLQRERLKRETQRTIDFWRLLLGTKESRHELWNILDRAGVFRAPFASTNGFPNKPATFYQLGKRDFAESLYHQCLAADLEGTRSMLIEHDADFAELAPELKRRGAHG